MTRSINDIDLMQYLDGELAGDETRELGAALASNEEAQQALRSYKQLGECVRTYSELEADDADEGLARVWERIESRLSANGAAEAAAPVPTPVPRPKARDVGAWAKVGEWLDSVRGYFVTGAVTAAAAAAVVLMLTGGEKTAAPGIAAAPGPSRTLTPQPAAALISQPPEVESLEIYGASGSVLTIPSEDSEGGTAVIWLDRESHTEGPI